MKNRKIVIAVTALFITFFSITTTYAQTGRDSAATRRWEEKLGQMKTELQLTAVQTDSISTIHKEFQTKRDAVFVERVDGREKMVLYKTLMQDMNQRLKATLGQELFTRYETWLNEHPNNPNRKK